VLSPSHLAVDVPANLLIAWDECTDPAATGVGIELEPKDGIGVSVEAHPPVSETQYGPVSLTPGIEYVLQFDFGHAYRRTNADGIEYVVDTDSERKLSFTTPEPAAGSLLGLGAVMLLRRRRKG